MTSRPVYTSTAEGFRDAKEIAGLRPMAEPRPRAPRKAPNPGLRQVTNGIVCFCGERFGESDALEFMLHLRAEVGEELGILSRRRQYEREYWTQRRRDDPEYRERQRKYEREWNAAKNAEIRKLHRVGDHSHCYPTRCASRRKMLDPESLALVEERVRRQQELQTARRQNLTPEERERRNTQRNARRKVT